MQLINANTNGSPLKGNATFQRSFPLFWSRYSAYAPLRRQCHFALCVGANCRRHFVANAGPFAGPFVEHTTFRPQRRWPPARDLYPLAAPLREGPRRPFVAPAHATGFPFFARRSRPFSCPVPLTPSPPPAVFTPRFCTCPRRWRRRLIRGSYSPSPEPTL